MDISPDQFVQHFREREAVFDVTAFDACCRYLNHAIEQHHPDVRTVEEAMKYMFKIWELGCIVENEEVHGLVREAARHWTLMVVNAG